MQQPQLQLPLLKGEFAYVPSMAYGRCSTIEEAEDAPAQTYTVNDFYPDLFGWSELAAYLDELEAGWLASQGIDIDAELDDLREDIADREFFARGDW